MTSGVKIITRILILALSFSLWACQKQDPPSQIVGRTMGTSFSVKYVAGEKTPHIKSLEPKINKILVDLNMEMSTYIKTSEISRFNKSQEVDRPFKISPDFYKTLVLSIEIAEKTTGHFDPTIGPLVNLWGFGPKGLRKVPSPLEIKKAMARVGYDKLTLLDGSISKSIPNLYLDLSASAKGYGVDLIAAFLEANFVDHYMVEIGGEVKTKGTKNGSPWRIGIETPSAEKAGEPIHKVLKLNGEAVATSGNYRNFFEDKGKRYGHTIDFRTGRPAENTLASVTVVHDSSCAKADAWATALMTMGATKGLVFAEKNGIKALFIYRPAGQTEGAFVEAETSFFESFVEGRK
ncbi:MAG: thiamine biosynthesis lipoprotein [Bacteriovoracaceae bacterium]|jgi:thiamine biosynthesis lipoprotein